MTGGGVDAQAQSRSDQAPAPVDAPVVTRLEVVVKGALGGSVAGLPGGRGHVELPGEATVTSLVAALGLPAGPWVAVVDGAAVRGAAPLPDGARVELHPPMAGG